LLVQRSEKENHKKKTQVTAMCYMQGAGPPLICVAFAEAGDGVVGDRCVELEAEMG
jgi:hypothetical protein